MAILQILTKEDPRLRKTSRPVEEITPRILRLLDDMKDTLHKANGAGLAAPQVGVLRRIVLVETEPGELLELINPEIVAVSEERQEDLEGCLSVPGEWGITDRPMTVTVRAQDRNGTWFEATGSGLKARCFCHELDHLDGVLYIDKAIRMLDDEDLEE
ncbi:MAG: peptide deformylase [Ruminococcaceae bacterium]|nr:peptide deformylase [Oscillospiraceae bacterium]